MTDYYLIYKPFGMLSQFSKEGDHTTLADLRFQFAKDIYPIGRLDADSEGLLLLTNDNYLKTKLLHPKNQHYKTYYVQVEGAITAEACRQLEDGVTISINGKAYHTLRSSIKQIQQPILPERNPPIRFRKNIPTSWISVQIHEGKNRQIRKMTAAVGFPTLRLVRYSIGRLMLNEMQPGDVIQLDKNEVQKAIR